MSNELDAFAFPELPDEAVVAINNFIEHFYNAFQNHYCAQLHRWYHDQRISNDPYPPNRDPSY